MANEQTNVTQSLMIKNPNANFPIPENAITSKVVFDNAKIRTVYFALDKGEQLTEHAVPKAAIITLLEGNLGFTIEDTAYDLLPGDVIYLAPKAKHSVNALAASKFSLIMIEV